jgi:hypothetical protein
MPGIYYISLVSRTSKSNIFVLPLAVTLIPISLGWAQDPKSINDLAACINEKLVNQGNVDISAAVEKCMPQGCKVTASMSTFSAQPACGIANTLLPRVYLNCPGPSAGLRFRPTFTLCPDNANRIEVGEDVPPIAPSPAVPLQMANFPIPMNEPILHELSDYLNTSNNNLRCTRCHGNASPAITGDSPLLSSPFDPFSVQRRNLLPLIIYSNEPTRKALIAPLGTVSGLPVTAQTLDQICARIQSTLEDNPFSYGTAAPTQALCKALASYTTKRSCGNGVLNTRCSGVTGGGIFVQNGVTSTVTLEFSGQPVFDPESPERLTFKANDVDGTLTAVNSSTQTTIAAVALSALEEIEGADGDGVQGDGNYAFSGTGKAWMNGVATAIAVRISFNKANDLTRVAITSPAETEFYAGGTAVGVRFTVTSTVPVIPSTEPISTSPPQARAPR